MHEYPKAKLRALWNVAAPRLGYSPAAIRYIHELIGFTSSQDYEPNSICAVFYGVGKLSHKLSMPPRTMSRVERDAEKEGLLVRTCTKGGKRKGERENGGAQKIKWAFGINLGPLIDRVDELQEIVDEVEAEGEAMRACRSEIKALRYQMIVSGYEAEAVKAYPRGRPSEITCLVRLRSILSALRAAYKLILGVSGRPNCPTGSAKSERPNTIQESKSIDSTEDHVRGSLGPEVDLSPLEFIATPELKEAVEIYSQCHDPFGALSLACRDRCSTLGISGDRWLLTKRTLGVSRAVLFVAMIDRNAQRPLGDPYRARNPQGCLSGMARKYLSGHLNLCGLITKMKKSSERLLIGAEESKVTLMATPTHLVREGALRSFPSTPTHAGDIGRYSKGIANGES